MLVDRAATPPHAVAGCSKGRIREPAPPRTQAEMTAVAARQESTMAEDSPCRRTPSTMPSSVHSMGKSV